MSFRERQRREGYFDASTQSAASCFRVFCCAYGDDGFRRERFALTKEGAAKRGQAEPSDSARAPQTATPPRRLVPR
jgi:hypothetical protein